MILRKVRFILCGYSTFMASVEELWQKAHEIYARARSSIDPLTQRALMNAADDYLKQAEEIRRSQIIKAEFPKSNGKFESVA